MMADKNHLWAIALFLAMKGETSLLEKFEHEMIELWNGDGI